MVCDDKHKTTTLVVEAAIVISEVSNPTNNCFGARCCDTEVVLTFYPPGHVLSISESTMQLCKLSFLFFSSFFDDHNFGLTLIIAHDSTGSLF